MSSKVKVMLTVFFNSPDMLHQQAKILLKSILWKSSVVLCMWEAKCWQLHRNNTPAYSSQLTKLFFFLPKYYSLVCHTPNTPNMVPCGFWQFPKIKTALKETWFQLYEDIIRNATVKLSSIPKEIFRRYFQPWLHRWEKCVQSPG